jgi:DNA-binding response OmpR family regulator
MAPACLLVADGEAARRAVSYALDKEGFRLIRVEELSTALKILVKNSFDLNRTTRHW